MLLTFTNHNQLTTIWTICSIVLICSRVRVVFGVSSASLLCVLRLRKGKDGKEKKNDQYWESEILQRYPTTFRFRTLSWKHELERASLETAVLKPNCYAKTYRCLQLVRVIIFGSSQWLNRLEISWGVNFTPLRFGRKSPWDHHEIITLIHQSPCHIDHGGLTSMAWQHFPLDLSKSTKFRMRREWTLIQRGTRKQPWKRLAMQHCNVWEMWDSKSSNMLRTPNWTPRLAINQEPALFFLTYSCPPSWWNRHSNTES